MVNKRVASSQESGVRILWLLLLLLISEFCLLTSARAQQPQTSTAPVFAASAKYVQGVGPGYRPAAGSGLTLNIAAGTAICNSQIVDYAGGALDLLPNATNYVYLNPAGSCTPESGTSSAGAYAGLIPVAKVVTNASTITSITDLRSWFAAGETVSVSVKDFGAKGDGTSDDTAALQAAVNSGAGRLLFPPGKYRVTSTITVCNQLLEGLSSPGSNENGRVAAVYHDFDGTLFKFDGSCGDYRAGGGIQRLVLIQKFGDGTGPGRGKAIELTGSSAARRATWIRLRDLQIESWAEGTSVSDEWTWGIYIDGSAIGAPEGVRDIWVSDSRIVANTASGGGLGIVTAYNIFISNLELNLANTRLSVSGSPGNSSSSIFIVNSTAPTLEVDYAQSVSVVGGAYTTILTTANSSSCQVTGAVAFGGTTLAGSGHVLQTYDGSTGRETVRSNTVTALAVTRDQNAGDSSNIVQLSVGNNGSNQGEGILRYTNAAASGSPTAQMWFFPRNNANTTNFSGGGLTLQKVAGVDNSEATLTNIRSSFKLDRDVNLSPSDAGDGYSYSNLFASGTTRPLLALYNTGGASFFGDLEGLSGLDGMGVYGQAKLKLYANGPVEVLAGGTDEDVTLTPTGTGAVKPRNVAANANTVPYSPTPTFDASLGNTQKVTLTGSVTSSTLSNAKAGQWLFFIICQDATGSRTFAWPTNVKGGMTVGGTLSTCSAQSFIFDGTNAYALSPGVTNM
jgi:hypothetical protein